MRKMMNWTLVLVAFVFIFSSCVSKKKYTQLMDDKMSVEESLASAQTKVTKLEEDIKTLEEDKTTLAENYAADKEKWDNLITKLEGDLKTAKTELTTAEAAAKKKEDEMVASIKSVFSPYEGEGLSITEKNGRLYVSMAAPIEYRSGSTRISKDQKATITALANILKTNPAVGVLVEGHSDNVPVKEGARFANNMELSMARANKVVRALVKEGADATQLTAVGRGSTMPAADGEASRRTEFVIIPDLTRLYRMKGAGA
ncbi:MAG: OmpA family protein [Saprospiraceae bacterium]